MKAVIHIGGALKMLRGLPGASVQCCVTSPPYWGLRDYGVTGQIGLERTPKEYVEHVVEVFREVRRVLRDDGTVWLNLGDSYNGSGGVGGSGKQYTNQGSVDRAGWDGLKPKDLVGIPWRVAFALQADGWYLRSDIIWNKPNPMPESVTDRPTKSHEYIFLLTKNARYYYDAEAIKEKGSDNPITVARNNRSDMGLVGASSGHGTWGQSGSGSYERTPETTRNKRTVWTVATHPYSEAHFATFPPKLITPCIKAGTSERGCCSNCGAPWERKTETESLVSWEDRKARGATAGSKERGYNENHGAGMSHTLGNKTITTGWQPSCECGPPQTCVSCLDIRGLPGNCDCTGDEPIYQPVPCTVLDPFSGSGTTGMVALGLGRDYIGIELSPEYAEMSRKRIEGDAPMFNRVEVLTPEHVAASTATPSLTP